MKERPILFSSEMVNAILHGTANTKAKTQTRRTKGLEKINHNPDEWEFAELCGTAETPLFLMELKSMEFLPRNTAVSCPYGEKGDRLWVRETWATLDHGYYVIYKADLDDWSHMDSDPEHKWKPAIHMTRKASRITLEIQDIRVQRLQDITDADAIAEGVAARNYSAKEGYLELWDSIHGKDAHTLNPFVWVIDFKRLEADK